MWTWSLKYVPFSEYCNAVQYVHSPSISQQEGKFNIDSGPRDKSLDWSGQDTPGIGDLVPAWDSQGSGGSRGHYFGDLSPDIQFHGFNCEVLSQGAARSRFLFCVGFLPKQTPLQCWLIGYESALQRSLCWINNENLMNRKGRQVLAFPTSQWSWWSWHQLPLNLMLLHW